MYRQLTLTVCEQRFALEGGGLKFHPGQYMIFRVPGIDQVVRRSYSISSSPSDKDHFEICVRAVSGGFCSNYIHRLRPGESIQVEGPYGEICLEEKSDREILIGHRHRQVPDQIHVASFAATKELPLHTVILRIT